MNLENITISLDLAKKLKELGVKKDSLFYWINCEVDFEDGDCYLRGLNQYNVVPEHYLDWAEAASFDTYEYEKEYEDHFEIIDYPAYTTDELLEMLEPYYYGKEQEFGWWMLKCSESRTNHLAMKLIYLIENKLITL